jgi:hypothetical protein
LYPKSFNRELEFVGGGGGGGGVCRRRRRLLYD